MQVVTLGIIGCGNISDAYLNGAARSALIRVKSCADLRPEAAEAKARQHGCAAVSVDALLQDPEIDIVVNLTVPTAHADIGRQAVAAGKHVYSEKPLATTTADADALIDEAARRGVRVGCAPDTFLGASHQTCRRLIDAGRIGRVIGGTVTMMSRGMEHWHPNPDFFFKPGGGPLLDIGPYYITELVNLLGPVAAVTSVATQGYPVRVVTSEPNRGHEITVEVPTTVHGALAFANGANVALSLSWDVWKHRRLPIELYGTEGSLLVPDPNFFGDTPSVTRQNGDWQDVPIDAQPFGAPNRHTGDGRHVADYRIIGVLDMAAAIREGRPHRASGELARHVLDVLEGLERAATERCHIAIESQCARPDPVPEGRDEQVFLAG